MQLLSKYNIPVPRYTSYPTVPYWNNTPDQESWKNLVRERFRKTNTKNGISLYIHLPFCESLCTYCACNTRITVNHKVEGPYIDSVLKEWALYRDLMHEVPRIKELHLGGGTPTFFSPANLQRLIEGILVDAEVCQDHEFSFEGHPANTSAEHLQVLYTLGFRRVSFGIQDFDPFVQDVINRYQSVEQVRDVVRNARAIGYESVNFDLVYGLPHQKLSTLRDTVQKTIELRPDRIAFYSYAHVPWLRPGQRKFDESDLPLDSEKRQLYELGRDMLIEAGYTDIGMDHFALESDPLFRSAKKGKLHRNFMGYTDRFTDLMISLGCSAISDTWDGFAQNIKAVEAYQQKVNEGLFPIFKGHILDREDLHLRHHILAIICVGETHWSGQDLECEELSQALARCGPLIEDGLVRMFPNRLEVTQLGRAFLRNICLCFDARYWRKTPETITFSTVA